MKRTHLMLAAMALGGFHFPSSLGIPHPIPTGPRTVPEPITDKKRVTFKASKNRPKHIQRKKGRKGKCQ